MKTKSISGLLFILFFFTSFTSRAQNNNLTGEWKLNREKTILGENQLFLSRVTIQVKVDSLLTTRVYENGNGEEYPFEENLSLDGKECKIVIYEMPRTSKASRVASDGSILIESKTTFSGNNGQEDLLAKETWKVDNESKMLIIDFTNKMSAGEVTGKSYYNKVK
jgi:hypothetical protein